MNSLHPHTHTHTHTPTQLTSLHNREARASDGATGDPSDNIIGAWVLYMLFPVTHLT